MTCGLRNREKIIRKCRNTGRDGEGEREKDAEKKKKEERKGGTERKRERFSTSGSVFNYFLKTLALEISATEPFLIQIHFLIKPTLFGFCSLLATYRALKKKEGDVPTVLKARFEDTQTDIQC